MTTIETITTTVERPGAGFKVDDAQLAAVYSSLVTAGGRWRRYRRCGVRADSVPRMGIIDDLLAHPGIYLGVDRDADSRGASAAKIVVAPLPGGAGVTLDYETFNAGNDERVRGHAEHAVLGRTQGGGAILVTGHIHADTVAVLRESQPGVFVMGAEPSAFPVAISISMPEPGTLIHIWSYGAPGEDPVERDRAELTLST